MSIERPAEWHPPAPDHGGEDIPELYARMLVDEVVGMMCAETRNFDLPIAQGIDALTQEQAEISERLKKSGQYFHLPDGSVFMDYKIMRGEAYRKMGREIEKEDPEEASVAGYNILKKKFNSDMSTDDALKLARSIIAGWDWE
jgi:hypothetical protein